MIELLTEEETLVIRRMKLEPGEAMHWHHDVCRRFTVVVQGSRLGIEYLNDSEDIEFDVFPGMTGWDEPESQVHRAVNRGADTYEEVVTFYRENSSIDPQPIHTT